MALQVQRGVARLVSAYDQPERIVFNVTNVIPGTYVIPGTCMEKRDIDQVCKVSLRDFDASEPETFQYAELLETEHGAVVVLTVFDGFSPTYSGAIQDLDEYNQEMSPNSGRMMRPVPAVKIANECEENYRHFGVFTIAGEMPTAEDIQKAQRAMRQYKLDLIMETNRNWRRFGERAVSPQARRIANQLFDIKRIAALPDWATIQLDMKDADQACPVCGTRITKNMIKCPTQSCQAILDWKRAVEFGFVKPADVPPMKRKEAGLETEPEVPVPVLTEQAAVLKGDESTQ